MILLHLDKYIISSQPNGIMPFQVNLALKEAPRRRPRYFKGKKETTQPKLLASPSTLLALPTRTNSN
jgi:hypothetical protein